MSDGTVPVAALDLPFSSLLDETTRRQVLKYRAHLKSIYASAPGAWDDPKTVAQFRAHMDQHWATPVVARLKHLYQVNAKPETLGGVHTDIVTPTEGVAAANAQRVLINLHGGGFTLGARLGGLVESIPVAARGRIKVVSVDYRMAPEHEFPAATEDVLAVYKVLLAQYAPQSIGIFGSSAGAMLTSQITARLLRDGLPLPGAIGMLAGGADYWAEGDSLHWHLGIEGGVVPGFREHLYFKNTDPNDPLARPLTSDAMLAKFPPSLLVASTRDLYLSPVVHTHSRLVALGVKADLHLWEGLGHVFYYDPDLPQSAEVHDVTARFFDRQLAKKS